MLPCSSKDAAAAAVATAVLVGLLFARPVIANNGVVPLPIYGYGRFPVGIRSHPALVHSMHVYGTGTDSLVGSARS